MVEQSSVDGLLNETERRMSKAVEAFQRESTSIRTGRASPALVETLLVDYYGTPTPLNQLASISAPEARLLVIQPWDPQALAAIERQIQRSDLGLTPSNDGSLIRLPIPPLTEERRRELVKQLKQKQEASHVAIRNVRRDTLERLRGMEKEKALSEDDLRRSQERLQKLTDEHIAQTNSVSAKKEAEVMEI